MRAILALLVFALMSWRARLPGTAAISECRRLCTSARWTRMSARTIPANARVAAWHWWPACPIRSSITWIST